MKHQISVKINTLNPFVGPTLGIALALLCVRCHAIDPQGRILIGTDGGVWRQVKTFDGLTLTETSSLFPYDTAYRGGVRVAAGDLNGDGFLDIITGTSTGASHVKAFSGKDGSLLHSFLPYGPNFSGGIFVGSGDVNGDGLDDIVTGAGPGAGPHVKVFDGRTGAELQSFFAYDPNFKGGVRVAAGDIDGDGRADIITGATVNAHVKVFSGKSQAELASFAAFDPQFSGGVFVAAGDLNGDGLTEIVVGADAGGGPHVRVFDGRTGGLLHSFVPFPATYTGGVRVAAADLDGDGRHEILVGPGAGMTASVRVFDGVSFRETAKFLACDESFSDGVFIAAGSGRRPVLGSRFDPKERSLVLYWPAGTRCVLEANSDLADTRGWKPVEVLPVQNGNSLEMIIPSKLAGEFFRLNCAE